MNTRRSAPARADVVAYLPWAWAACSKQNVTRAALSGRTAGRAVGWNLYGIGDISACRAAQREKAQTQRAHRSGASAEEEENVSSFCLRRIAAARALAWNATDKLNGDAPCAFCLANEPSLEAEAISYPR